MGGQLKAPVCSYRLGNYNYEVKYTLNVLYVNGTPPKQSENDQCQQLPQFKFLEVDLLQAQHSLCV